MTNTLRDLYAEHEGYVSDKWEAYFPVYERWLSPYRALPVRLLEVGVQNGGSLALWAKFFPNALQIVGCDIVPKCGELTFSDARVQVVVGDVNLASTRQALASVSPGFDIVIDDGSHRSRDIVKTFLHMYPLLAPGGLYVAEDLHCSYWSRWGGGLWRRDAAMEFFKTMADVVNVQSWGAELPGSMRVAHNRGASHQKFRVGDFTDLESVAFYNSMCVIAKGHQRNNIGGRVLAGQNAPVYAALPEAGSPLGVPRQPRTAKKLNLK